MPSVQSQASSQNSFFSEADARISRKSAIYVDKNAKGRVLTFALLCSYKHKEYTESLVHLLKNKFVFPHQTDLNLENLTKCVNLISCHLPTADHCATHHQLQLVGAPVCNMVLQTSDSSIRAGSSGTAKQHLLHLYRARFLRSAYRHNIPASAGFKWCFECVWITCLWPNAFSPTFASPSELGVCFPSSVTTRAGRGLLQEVLQLCPAAWSLIPSPQHKGFFFWHSTWLPQSWLSSLLAQQHLMVWFPTTTSSRKGAAQKHRHLLRARLNRSFLTFLDSNQLFQGSSSRAPGSHTFPITYTAEALQLPALLDNVYSSLKCPGAANPYSTAQHKEWGCTRRKTSVSSCIPHSGQCSPTFHPPTSGSVTTLPCQPLPALLLPCTVVPKPSPASHRSISGKDMQNSMLFKQVSKRLNKNTLE